MVTIEEWFKTKDYGIGLAVLAGVCKNRILLMNLSRKKNSEKLEYELTKIAKEQGIVFGKEEETTGGEPSGPLPPVEETGGAEQTSESHSDLVIDQMNADKGEELAAGANQVVEGKLEELNEGADDIVNESINTIEDEAEAIVASTKNELELMADQVITGKLKIVREGKDVSFGDLSPEMKARWEQNRDAYKEIRVLHEKLKLMENATPEDRQPLTLRISELDDKIRENWKEIDAWVPATETKVEAIDHKRMQANRKYISTNLKKLAEVTDPVKKAKVIAELQGRFNEVKASGETFAAETIEELAKAGVVC